LGLRTIVHHRSDVALASGLSLPLVPSLADGWPQVKSAGPATRCRSTPGGVASLALLFSDQGGDVRIEIRGRNVEVTEELREHVEKRFRRIGNQVADQAVLDVQLSEERNPAIPDSQVAEATLQLKGVTLRAHEASPDMMHTVHELAEDVRRQVKRHREKRRKRHQTRRMVRGLREKSADS
jgi:putative sigma-54 modulation protein